MGMFIGGIILFFLLKSARNRFTDVMKENDKEWDEKNNTKIDN